MSFRSHSVVLRRWLAACLCLLFTGGAAAADYYDGTYLTIPMVSALGHVYTNVKITVASVGSVLNSPAQNRFDSYSGGSLFIPSVYFNGTQFTNVTVTVGSIVSVGGVASANSYLLVANPNDQTLKAYPYIDPTQSVSQVSDPALANVDPNHSVKIVLDRADNLLFDVVRLNGGGVTVTPFSFNASTGILGIAGPPSTFSSATNVAVNPLSHVALVIYKTGPSVLSYSYNTTTGAIGTSPINTVVNATIGTLVALDPVNDLAFSMSNTGFLTYPTTSDSINFSASVASTTSLIPAYVGVNTQNLYSQPDMTNDDLLLIADASSGSGTEFQVLPYAQKTLGPAGSVLTDSTTDYLCGIDPTSHLVFVGVENSSQFRAFAYAPSGAISSASTTDMSSSPIPNGYPGGGCNDVDPTNHLLITSTFGSNSSNVTYYLYSTANGALTTIPAGSFAVTPGLKQLGIMATNSVTTDQ